MYRTALVKATLRIALPPISLVLAVLGSIIGGVAAPTEAASMGALGSVLVVALAGRFNFNVLRETTLATTRITAGMMFILICAQVFALSFRGLHGALVPTAAAQSQRRFGVGGLLDRTQPANIVFDATLRLGLILLVAPPEVPMLAIYNPSLATWLPRAIGC